MNPAHNPDSFVRIDRRSRIRVRVRALLALGVWFLVAALFFYFLDDLRMVLLDLLAAFALASMLRPLTHWRRGPQWLRGLVVGFLFIVAVAAALAGLGWLLSGPVGKEMAEWPKLHSSMNRVLEHMGDRLGFKRTLDVQTLADQFGSFVTGSGGSGLISSAASFTSHILVTIALVFVGMIYMLIEPEGRLLGSVLPALPLRRRSQLKATLRDMEVRLRWWLFGVLISMVLIGSLSWVGYHFVHLHFALPLALFAGAAEIVPTIGALTAFMVAVLVAATQNSTFTLLGVIVVHSITLLIESHVILPLIMRRAVFIPPVVTLFTVVLWSELLGIGGLILALPLDLLFWSIFEHFVAKPRQEREKRLQQAHPPGGP